MSEHQNTIWMNVTFSVLYPYLSCGIIRVEKSLCYELGKIYGARFKQCIWQDGKFVEQNPRSSEQKSAIQPSLPLLFPIIPRKQAVQFIAQGLLSLIPGRLRPLFNRVLCRIRPIFVLMLKSDLTKRILFLFRRQTIPTLGFGLSMVKKDTSSVINPPIFLPGDVLISFGNDWDRPYHKKFYEIRKQTGVKVVSCCYDLIPVLYPQYFNFDSNFSNKFRSYLLEIADSSDLVLCISKQSEKDLKEMLHQTGGATPPTHVFTLGDNIQSSDNKQISTLIQTLCEDSFILFVSTIDRRKNHEVLYRAYHLLCKQGKRANLPKLIFVGIQGWGTGDLMKDIKLDPLTQGLIIALNHTTDAELRALYKSAKFCVYPSFYEGWGLPVGEALSFGKAVISSDCGSLPEVGGNIVTYVDPWDVYAWADEIYKLATDPDQLKIIEDKVRKVYKKNKWSDAALTIKKAIDNI